MKIRLGYVSICLSLGITASKTMTFSNYSKLDLDDSKSKLNEIILENFSNLKEILKFNFDNEVYFYRLSHGLIPLATHDAVIFDYVKTYKKEFIEIGNLIKDYGIRVDTHPDQFCVLNSPNEKFVKDSIKILEFHYSLFSAMKINGKAVLHVGGAYNDKQKALERFKKNFKRLDKHLQKMIILENDDKVFGVNDVLNLCEELGIPMVLDYHHYWCYNEGEDIKDFLPRIIKTWKGSGLRVKMHFSSPKSSKEKRSHSDYIDVDGFIDFLNILSNFDTDIDVMLECKAKDEALFRLIRLLRYKGYNISGTTIFLKEKEA